MEQRTESPAPEVEAPRERNELTKEKRWSHTKRTWLIGLPAVIVVGIVGLFVWGSFQPQPEGFAPDGQTVVLESLSPATVSGEETTSEPSEVIRYTVDARDPDVLVFFDFADGSVVDGDVSEPDWDLAFRRTKLLTNSGVTNPSGPGGAADLGELALGEATVPVSVVFSVDALGGDDEDEPENPAVGRWYTYSFISHIVSAKPNTYLVRTGEDMDALIQFDSYYCDDEESGCVTFRYILVPASDSEQP
jgi:hypothetical protein